MKRKRKKLKESVEESRHTEKKLEEEEKEDSEGWLGKDENENSPHRAEIKERKLGREIAQKQKGWWQQQHFTEVCNFVNASWLRVTKRKETREGLWPL
ncbi:hypothetical protein PV325_009355 [Microctonus aethiopoides]|nr:hypothetical protein PV325_009355 [Microctonus aethiopoides]